MFVLVSPFQCASLSQEHFPCAADTWLPTFNYDLGGTPAYDATILALNEAMAGCVWCNGVTAATLPPWVLASWPTAPPVGSQGALFMIYVPFERFAAILVCWERQIAGGWPVPGGTAMQGVVAGGGLVAAAVTPAPP